MNKKTGKQRIKKKKKKETDRSWKTQEQSLFLKIPVLSFSPI